MLARLLDPWAALLLGLIVATATVILIAAPGPRRLLAGETQATKPVSVLDIAVFVYNDDDPARCIGALWVHADSAASLVNVVVVPALAQGFLPGGGYEPLASIVDDAGPAAAAAALGEMTGVKMRWWVSGGLDALKEAFPAAFPSGGTRVAMVRMKTSVASWSGSAPPKQQFARQYDFLRLSLADSDFSDLNVIAFANYALAAPGLTSDLDLQAASSVAVILRGMGAKPVTVSTLPAVVRVTRGSCVWRLDSTALAKMRQTLASGAAPPDYGPLVRSRSAAATVVVAIDPLGAVQRPFLSALRRRLRVASGGPVRVVPLVARLGGDLPQALTRVLERTQAQAVVVALGWGSADAAAGNLGQRLAAVTSVLRSRGQPAVFAALPAAAAGQKAAAAVVAVAGAGGLPISSLPVVAKKSPAILGDSWARAVVATTVRACDPRLFAPRLVGTKLGVTYYERRHASVALTIAPPPTTGLLDVPGTGSTASSRALATSTATLLREFGWHTSTVSVDARTPRLGGKSIVCHADHLRLALALAGDLGLPARRVIVDPTATASLTLVVAAKQTGAIHLGGPLFWAHNDAAEGVQP